MPRTAVLAGALVALGGCTAVPARRIQDAVDRRHRRGHETMPVARPSTPRSGSIRQVPVRVEWEGEGRTWLEGGPLLLTSTRCRSKPGEVLANTYADLPKSFLLAPELLGDDLFDALSGHRVGARLLRRHPRGSARSPPRARSRSSSTSCRSAPWGSRNPPAPTCPSWSSVGTVSRPSPSSTTTRPRRNSSAYTLIQGDGAQIKTGSRVLVELPRALLDHARGHRRSTWPLEFAPWGFVIGEGALPPGLEQSLIDVNAGFASSIVIVPPG